MGRPFIVLGDKTDHGGEVIEASGVTDTHGKRLARVGDKVSCPKKGHGGTTQIVSGDLTMIIDGKAAARHGDKTACGATLISSQSVSTDAC
ncbi:MAG: PAAR domain-containing protein [Rhizobacter sp.]|nr:PAAR domain-containing protein [Rhizobacter sp.]